MQITNTENRYGALAVAFHWIMAILIIALLILGIYMTRIPISMLKLKLYGWHKELGILVLMLACARIGWRLASIIPTLPVEIPAWQKLAARAAHWAFYGFMFAVPISGWLLTSAAGLAPSFFGLFLLPNLVAPDDNLRLLFTAIHKWLSYGLIALLCLHVAAALKHHFINKDNVLRGIL